MNFWTTLFGTSTKGVLESATGLVKSVYSSPGEKLSREEALQKVENVIVQKQQTFDLAQTQTHTTVKKAAGWLFILGVFTEVIIRPFAITFGLSNFPHIDIAILSTALGGFLGFSTLHLVDKLRK